MYRKILYIPQPCTGKIRERERERGGGKIEGERERGGKRGERGGDRGETGGRQGGDRGETGGRQGRDRGETGGERGERGGGRGERKRKLIFFFVQMNGKPQQKRLLPLFFFKE